MSHLSWLFEAFQMHRSCPFMVFENRQYSYAWLLESVARWTAKLSELGMEQGTVTAIRGDFTPESVAAALALIERSAVLVPLSPSVDHTAQEYMEIAEAGLVLYPGENGPTDKLNRAPENVLTRELIARGHPGLVLFSSGSTGKSKAALHDIVPLLDKFRQPRRSMVTMTFLMFDHIGGFNTLFYILANAGTAVTSERRDADSVCAAIEAHQVELLPTTPTFLNLLLISEAFRRYDLSSLKVITYGTEPMPNTTLARINEVFPHCAVQQTYGLSEVGILRSKSQCSDSLWVKVGGEGFDTEIRGGTLWIKARSAMLGYLNAPSPFDDKGWFDTGDAVEVRGDYVRFLGRRSEIINVGGQKVYPAEVESVLLEIENIRDATVVGQSNPITGNMVIARLNLMEPEEPAMVRRRVRDYCRSRLESFKVPARIEITDEAQFSGRFKKFRSDLQREAANAR
jgi:long-chain acyl-CoA synthetase